MTMSSINLSSDDVFDIIHSTRAMRRLKPDPVPDASIIKILQAATCAPNGGNQQSWHFVVIKDVAIKEAVQVWYRKAPTMTSCHTLLNPHIDCKPPYQTTLRKPSGH